jgi:hypothetical protein
MYFDLLFSVFLFHADEYRQFNLLALYRTNRCDKENTFESRMSINNDNDHSRISSQAMSTMIIRHAEHLPSSTSNRMTRIFLVS